MTILCNLYGSSAKFNFLLDRDNKVLRSSLPQLSTLHKLVAVEVFDSVESGELVEQLLYIYNLGSLEIARTIDNHRKCVPPRSLRCNTI